MFLAHRAEEHIHVMRDTFCFCVEVCLVLQALILRAGIVANSLSV